MGRSADYYTCCAKLVESHLTMARYYSNENIKILEDDRAHLRWRSLQLQQRFTEHQFGNEQAKEFALMVFQGDCRL